LHQKFQALKELLNDCGIGLESDNNKEVRDTLPEHRVLIFAQLKSMLDLIETDLFQIHMPSVTYLRLDGSVDATKRHDVVTKFNGDTTIDCLLLTTSVGGLGLNLTGADVVIFMEHDWNPAKDLQAMDRAHRIGSKKTVNVYRLITRGTLEEKVMGIQKFKQHMAKTIINEDNTSLKSMETNQILELFHFNPSQDYNETKSRETTQKGEEEATGLKSVLTSLSKMWEEQQYQDEFALSSFIQNMQED